MPDLIFAKLCQETIENRESLEQYLRLLKILKENNADLIPTVATYLYGRFESAEKVGRYELPMCF